LDPTTNILRLLLGGMIPVSDLAERTQLPANDILQTVEKLRDRQQVEIVEIPDQPGKKFIRLTKTGYAVFAA
jgi:DNA-binding MarR family transcriptional regulator